MKLFLVVSQGVHTGKQIPVSGTEFLIGRDPHCQLRPASPAISKQHCGISVREGKLFVRDYGSTNGTFLNGEQIAGEREAKIGDHLKVGPLEFKLGMEATGVNPALKPSEQVATSSAVVTPKAAIAKPAPAAKASVAVAEPPRNPVATIASIDDTDADQMAALLLMEDDGGTSTPTINQMNDATTVMEMPAVGPAGLAAAGAAEKKKEEPKKGHGDSSSAAHDALQKYFRRPRT
jgi:pSer/pThr/pTyr-binding forkhead associated (FHA) protein